MPTPADLAADFDNLLLAGIAQLLATNHVAQYSATGAYNAGDTAITIQKLPADPDNAIALTTYPVSDDPTLSDSVIGLQVKTRTAGADPRPTNTLAGLAYNALHGLQAVLPSGVTVVLCTRQSGSALGQDDRDRSIRVDNYYLQVWRPAPNRL